MKTLVTGAGGAVGSAIAMHLLAKGEEVIVHDVNRDSLDRLYEGSGVFKMSGDLADNAVQEALAATWAESGIDGVVAAHGIDGSAALAGLDRNFFRKVMRVNALSVFSLFRLALPALERSNGVFVAVASQAGLHAEANNVAYCAAKYGVVGWGRAMAELLRGRKVSVRVLCPGCVKSPLLFSAQKKFAQETGLPESAFLEKRLAGIPANRFAEPAEIAEATSFLLEKDKLRPVVFAPTGGETLL